MQNISMSFSHTTDEIACANSSSSVCMQNQSYVLKLYFLPVYKHSLWNSEAQFASNVTSRS